MLQTARFGENRMTDLDDSSILDSDNDTAPQIVPFTTSH
jgi:hypothetical protein